MDKYRKILGWCLVLFAFAGIAVWAHRTFSNGSKSGSAPEALPGSAQAVVYYFHTNYRCATCMKFETYTRSELATDFAKPLADGTVLFCVVNVEEPGNEHFVDDYALKTKSIVLVAPGGKPRWKNLDRIWDEVGSEAGFKRYLQTELQNFLAGAS